MWQIDPQRNTLRHAASWRRTVNEPWRCNFSRTGSQQIESLLDMGVAFDRHGDQLADLRGGSFHLECHMLRTPQAENQRSSGSGVEPPEYGNIHLKSLG